MATRIVETSEASQTEALGAELASELNSGDIVLIRGELGAGKTTLVRGAALALGVEDPITSPTFAIGHRYKGRGVTVSHLDLYRLAGLSGEEPELLDDYLGPGRIAFVEWPEEDSPELKGARWLVTLTHAGGDERLIEVRSAGGEERPNGERPNEEARPNDARSADGEVGSNDARPNEVRGA